jgi:hypothetical protein
MDCMKAHVGVSFCFLVAILLFSDELDKLYTL